jgi:hypothetical protein
VRGALVVLLFLTAPAAAQIATPVLVLPPCVARCLNRQHGATAEHYGAPSAVKQACPAGTVFDAYKGTCHMLPAPR